MEAKRYQFAVNTSNTCLFCLDPITLEEVNDINKQQQQHKNFSLHNIFRFLNIDLSKLDSLSKKSTSLLNRTDVRVNLCDDCGVAMERFSEHHKAMELIRMKLESTLKTIKERLNRSNDNPNLLEEYLQRIKADTEMECQAQKHSKIVDEIRTEVLSKCNSKVKNIQPKLKLEAIKIIKTEVNLDRINDKTKNKSGRNLHFPETKEDNTSDSIAVIKSEYNYDDVATAQSNYDLEENSNDHLEIFPQTPEEEKPPKDIDVDSREIKTEAKAKGFRQIVKKANGLFSCNLCPKTFTTRQKCQLHMNLHEGKGHKCSICSKLFTNKCDLERHLRTHSGHKPFKCHFCHNGFAQKSTLENHLRIHTKQKPFKCEICSMTFAVLHNCRKHQRIHTGERKQYPCQICKKTFPYSTSLNRHMLIHSNERSFKCGICSKAFAREDRLKEHKKARHTGNQPYNCQHCGMSYSTISHFKFHLKSHDESSKSNAK